MSLQKYIRRCIDSLSFTRSVPPPGFDFRAAAEQYARRLRREWSAIGKPPTATGKQIGVVVSPWLFTPAPFFMIELALQLRSSGHSVVLLWDGGNAFVDAAKPREIAAIRPLLDLLPGWLPLVDTGTLPSVGGDAPEFLEELLYENAVRHLRGEAGAKEFLETHPEWEKGMAGHCSIIGNFLGKGRVDSLCIPGGVWACSGVWRKQCEALGLPYTTYDSGPGQVFFSRNSVAAHFGDIRPALEKLLGSGRNMEPLVSLARQALQTRMDGRDPFALQKTARKSDGEKYDVFVPLNLRFDSAALCRQKLFHSVTDWLHSLLSRLTSRPGVTVAIRQHPCERIAAFRGRDSWEDILATFLRPGGPVRFFPAEAEVNSYDLIEGAKLVLPFTSRVGIEAAMMGKPVLTSASCYYNDCGFTVAPASVEGYFEAIDLALAGGHIPDETARMRAAVAYYLMEYCTALASRFTPQPADYTTWMGMAPGELAALDEVRMITKAASGETSFTLLLHEQKFQEQKP